MWEKKIKEKIATYAIEIHQNIEFIIPWLKVFITKKKKRKEEMFLNVDTLLVLTIQKNK